MTANIACRLTEQARERGRSDAVIDSRTGQRWTFAELDQDSDRLARGFRTLGAGPGTRIALMVPPGFPFFSLTFAIFKLGAVPVLIDPGMGARGLGQCLSEAAPAVFIGSAKAHVARTVLGWLRGAGVEFVQLGRWPGFGSSLATIRNRGGEGPPVLADAGENDPAAILYTSGSTGPAKGALYTHGMFHEQVRVLREELGIAAGEIDLCTFPLFALFGPALGMTSIVPDMDPTRPAKADPKKLVAAITRYQVTNLFGSPALVNTLSRYGEAVRLRLPTLRRVLSAGAPVSAAVIGRMAALLTPGARVFTPYGATECLPVTIIDDREILGETAHATDAGAGVCVGRPVGRIEVRVIPASHEPTDALPAALQANQRGEITVAGPVVSASYWKRPDADRQHKIVHEGRVWHRTGDVGYFDTSGRLWFCGRKAHRVTTSDGTILDTIPTEAVFNTHPQVFRSALVGVRGRPVICVELERGAWASDTLVAELKSIAARHDHTRLIDQFLVYPGPFPVDIRHNAKIFREKLAVWASGRIP
jgi:acyl-CoA synthetase (AMP-forming)/AMP-acid ligase II